MLLYGKNRIGGIILCMPAGSRVDGHYKKNTHFSVITQLKEKYQPN
jgi:hypothetical protein